MDKARVNTFDSRNYSDISSAAQPEWRFCSSALLSGFLVGMAATCFGLAQSASAAELVQPFYSRNLNPFVQIYGLPAGEGPTLAEKGELEARLVLDVANNYTASADQGETIIIRGETYRSVVALRYGLRENMEVGIDLPYLSHGRGHLNDFIIDWHDTFGMSQGGRDKATDDHLAYFYANGGNDQIDVTGSASGLGDVLLSAAMPLWKDGEGENQRLLALRATLKVPTGSTSDLLGSGSTDLSLRLSGEDRQTLAAANITCFGTLGTLLMTAGDVIPERQRHAVGFGTIGFGWQPLTWLTLKLQLDGHTAFFDSELSQLGNFSSQLIMGGTVGLPGDFQFDLAVSEDIIVDTAPDVLFHFALRRMF
jgi:hypothetical protein